MCVSIEHLLCAGSWARWREASEQHRLSLQGSLSTVGDANKYNEALNNTGLNCLDSLIHRFVFNIYTGKLFGYLCQFEETFSFLSLTLL